ncbi:hypothetical protein A3F07_02665 [candidate division WWE3 bacterium RIFCSPHIGHO2_12_FULL_38_15]|uniref:Probable DNA ligase n=1 Tax=candidate division WWE3 bacterium RIFCSPHIGHO2_02_FULL_38_14 TaxID=1802620 RepID=A0A1F4V6U3_UNCKA|nr:MAG: hypothetical protein A2793_02720 [candidate division WWE3 bacterium RIFCSPHIGHO2_01_FULL_38_45]OGC48729.1 MAG: hypothetical protein A3F07_02665 [candidate division WWE3 bacterium RIFCSPHIGHO2_12_FULL_38_15]OGC52654.1 MAG: hypothetical protein A3B64_03970 [candidate division WWE3 bacterium RIFCSPLOWO2_01_FULL_37_24]OGC52928.1 MAG: hypothetical protein A3D91_03175 [candidate division WWE3 bacterium RIFCSPHIGHO2_02_FULL_38_14]HLB51486.1 ATP-dependent DNA ligase [Patescibacteria group bacte
MKFKDFAKYLEKLESTSKRLEITSILTDLIKNLDQEEAEIGVYLSLGYLKAIYENPKFNIAEKMMIKILEMSFETDKKVIESHYAKSGDLGDVAFELSKTKKSGNPRLNDVYKDLQEIAEVSGSGSQDLKINKSAELLKKLDPLSAKYAVRIILGTIRLGFTELTIIDALAQFLGDKTASAQIENRYSIHPDIGLVTKIIKKEGLKGIEKIKIEPGVPILAQRCQRLSDPKEVIEKMGRVWAEFKFDGTRVQLHMNRKIKPKSKDTEQNDLFDRESGEMLIKTYTRNLEETTHQYPDIIEAADRLIEADSVILDGEAIGFDKKTGEFLPFQETIQRKRKHGVAEMVKDIPLKYFVFDILYLNGKELIDLPLSERKELLKKAVKPNEEIIIDTYVETDNAEKLTEYFEEAKDKNLEGLILKKPGSVYQAGARSFSWVKMKKADTKLLEDTVDCVVLGYFYGKGVRAQFGIGGFLVGVYDEKAQKFKTITKIGTGLKEDDWIYLKKEADKLKTKEKPKNVEVNKILEPDVWIQPKIVVEVGADEISKSPTHTAGYALRFPRLIKFRTDKKPTDSTSIEEIKTLHNMQKRGYY